MLPVGLIGFMLPKKLEENFYADPPKNKFEGSGQSLQNLRLAACCNRIYCSEFTAGHNLVFGKGFCLISDDEPSITLWMKAPSNYLRSPVTQSLA